MKFSFKYTLVVGVSLLILSAGFLHAQPAPGGMQLTPQQTYSYPGDAQPAPGMVPATIPNTGLSLAIIAAAQGTPGTAIAPPTGGTGILGWLSGIYSKFGTGVAVTGSVTDKPAPLVLVPLDVAVVTTGGTAVTVLAAGERTAGGWLVNPTAATQPLCINEMGTASGIASAGSTTCIQPGVTYTISPSVNAVSVVAADSGHTFSGLGKQ